MKMKIKTDLIRKKIDSEKMTLLAASEKARIPYGSFLEIMRRGTCNGTTLGKLARFVGVKAYELVDLT